MSDYYYLHSKRSDQRIHIYIPLCLIISGYLCCHYVDACVIYIPLCLIITSYRCPCRQSEQNLHSTMSDYFFGSIAKTSPKREQFTFHYVWLFPINVSNAQRVKWHLHSTMSDYFFFALPVAPGRYTYLHSTMSDYFRTFQSLGMLSG